MAALVLPKELLATWQDAVTQLGKLPRGIDKKALSDDQLLYKIMRQELRGIHELWETFTQERDLLTKHLLGSKQQMVRYLLGFHLPNAARMQLALSRLNSRFPLTRLFTNGKNIRWNDLGCGSGAAAQVGLHFALKAGLKPAQLQMHLTDASGVLLNTARHILQHAAPTIDLQTHRLPLEKLKAAALSHHGDDELISIYSLAYVWNELERNPHGQTKLKEIFAAHLQRNEPALLIFLEPANQVFTRRLMQLRDELVNSGYLPLYPCPQAGPCPMLERVRDWCYSEGIWRQPLFMQRLDRELGVDRSHLSVAIYAFATPALLSSSGKTPTSKQNEKLRVVVGRPEKRQTSGRGSSKTSVATFDYLVCDGRLLTKSPPKVQAPVSPTTPSNPRQTATKKKTLALDLSLRGELL